MHLKLCLHFHAYQPGDIILRRPGSPMETPEFVERRSPVGLRAGDRLIRGENWTGAMLGFYREIWRLFGEMGREWGEVGGPFCSVDIEPATLQLLVQRRPGSFRALRRVIDERAIDIVATVPFHVLLPHVAPEEQRLLAALAFSLHGLLRAPEPGAPVGFWLPEGLYSREAGRSVVEAFAPNFAEGDRAGGEGARGGEGGRAPAGGRLFFILDRHQFLGLQLPQAALSANFVVLNGVRAAVFGRDRDLSDRWAFRQGTAPELAGRITSGHTDAVKEERGIQYALTMASDLESLAVSADQGERLRALRRALRDAGVEMLSHSVFLRRKLDGEYRRWEGEMEAEPFRVELREFSSWSDYMDQGVDYSSDTRWTGLRRWDGLVISRVHRGTRVSQLWKQGFMKVQERVERVVRRTVMEGLARCMAQGAGGPEEARRFLRAYAGVVFAPLCLACGPRGAWLEPDFHRVADTHLRSCRRDEEAALLARAYYEMLMSLRSCPRFWDNMDTRVTFQSSVLMAHALLDLADACERLGLRERAGEALRLFVTNLVDFHEVYRYYNLGSLFGLVGWEVSEDAWHMAVQSGVPERSGYDVVKRAALFVAIREGTAAASRVLAEVRFDEREVVADTAHIEGEGHGEWENPDFCENRT